MYKCVSPYNVSGIEGTGDILSGAISCRSLLPIPAPFHLFPILLVQSGGRVCLSQGPKKGSPAPSSSLIKLGKQPPNPSVLPQPGFPNGGLPGAAHSEVPSQDFALRAAATSLDVSPALSGKENRRPQNLRFSLRLVSPRSLGAPWGDEMRGPARLSSVRFRHRWPPRQGQTLRLLLSPLPSLPHRAQDRGGQAADEGTVLWHPLPFPGRTHLPISSLGLHTLHKGWDTGTSGEPSGGQEPSLPHLLLALPL